MFFTTPKISRITQPVLSRILGARLGEDIVLKGQSLELMYAIQKELEIFEPIEDDESRLIWLEIPRGTAKEWKAAFDEDDEPTEEEQQAFLEEYPRETQWVFLTTGTYRGFTSLRISDRDHEYRIFCNENHSSESVQWDMVWFLEPLLELVRKRVAEIAKAPEAYNSHIEQNLPYRQRSGRIRSREFNRILGKHLKVKDRAYCIEVMKELIRRESIYKGKDTDWQKLGVPEPLSEMTIRTFCRYYRIADTVFWKKSMRKREAVRDDVKYYTNHGLHGNLDEYNLDSQADFVKFANDHYGELGLSRMNVGASNWHIAKGKWVITFSFSYSAYLGEGLKIALALYETGAPFIFYNADNVLSALEETGWVRLAPFTFHDYINSGDDEGVYALPYVEYCNQEDEITREQYDEIVRLAKWEPTCHLQLDSTVPLESPLYESIRDQADNSLTISQIRHLIEEKHDTYLMVAQDDDTNKYYQFSPRYKEEHIKIPKKKYFRTFNEAMADLILLFSDEIKKKL